MGRPRKENAMTSTERARKYHLDPDKCLAGNKRKRDARKLKPLTYPLNETELEKKTMTDRLKRVGLKLKDRNRKRTNIERDIKNSTERVQKHCALKVKLDFKNKKQKN